MEIRINGETHTAHGPLSLKELLEQLDIPPASVAVERNGRIVDRKGFASVSVEDGDTLEIIRLVGGG